MTSAAGPVTFRRRAQLRYLVLAQLRTRALLPFPFLALRGGRADCNDVAYQHDNFYYYYHHYYYYYYSYCYYYYYYFCTLLYLYCSIEHKTDMKVPQRVLLMSCQRAVPTQTYCLDLSLKHDSFGRSRTTQILIQPNPVFSCPPEARTQELLQHATLES